MAIHLPKYKKRTIDHALTKYLRPKYIYIPLINSGDTNITTLVQKGDYVYKGSIVARRKNPFKIPFLSSVSGTVIDFEEHIVSEGKVVKCIKIENDYKEKVLEKVRNDHLNRFTKSEFIDIIKECGIIGMGGSGFPTFAKFDTKRKIHTLIVNAVESEPYITVDHEVITSHIEEILEAIDAILEINGIEVCYVAVRSNNHDLIKLINSHLGTYLKIKLFLVDDLYPMGWERVLVNKITKEEYKNYPTEIGVVVNNVSTIYAIYEALKYNRGLTERIVTFTGDMLKVPQNIIVKVGTPVKEVIDAIEGYKRSKDITFVAGGPMMGNSLPNDDLIVTANLNCVLIMRNPKEESALPCIRCGKCVKACPAKLSPVLIKDNLNNTLYLKKLQVEKCIQCGACSYICPSNLNVRDCVKLAQSKVRK
ncbi:MAG: RnfABCDGE type electron transport complex subunit C [Bacilli bacterium]|nr:RnfABCDGE type electron transport complex subunit C [Bacilli bacterium]